MDFVHFFGRKKFLSYFLVLVPMLIVLEGNSTFCFCDKEREREVGEGQKVRERKEGLV